VDAAIFSDQRWFDVGMCIRNSQGHFIRALTKWLNGSHPLVEAEAIGLREAIIWLGELGLSRVLIELDCKLVVDDISDSIINHFEFDIYCIHAEHF